MSDTAQAEKLKESVDTQRCENVPEDACLASPLEALSRQNDGIESVKEIGELSEELRMISYKTERLAFFVARSSKNDQIPEKRKALCKKHIEIMLEYKKVLSERITDFLEISKEEDEKTKKVIQEITESK